MATSTRARRSLVPFTVLLLTACGGPPAEPATPGAPPRLLVLSSTIGYVEPCGCTVDLLLGGIDRIASLVEAERKAGPTAVLLVGPHLFEKAPDPHLVGQEEARARLVGKALRRIGVDAAVQTSAELVRGRPFFDALQGSAPLPDVTANVPEGRGRVLTLGGVRVGVFGLVHPGADVPRGTPTDPEPAAVAEVARLKAEGAHVVVALGALPRKDLRALAEKVAGVDLWVLGDHPDELSAVSPAGQSFLLEAGDRGRNLGRVVLHQATESGPLRDPHGDAARERRSLELQIQMRAKMYERMPTPPMKAGLDALQARLAALGEPSADGKRLEYTLVPVTKEVVPEQTISAWLADYNVELKRINLEGAGEVAPVPEGESGFAGAEECVDCHKAAFQLWRATPHARAWQTLVDGGKTFDIECVSCHVTGWLKPGGTVLGKTAKLEAVQCEVCHGPSAVHVELGGDEDSSERAVP